MVKFQRSYDCEKSPAELKKRLNTTPLLTLLKCSYGYVIYCAAYRVLLGCVLVQQGQVIPYASRKLKAHKKNYQTHDLKLEAQVFARMIWTRNLYGVHVVVFNDDNVHQYLFNQKMLKLVCITILVRRMQQKMLLENQLWTVQDIEEERKELVKEVHRPYILGPFLISILDGGVKNKNSHNLY